MHPVVGAKLGKTWGSTQCLFFGNNVELHRIVAKAGWRCSAHRHGQKFNLFFVESGQIVVRTHKDNLDDESVLGPGEYTYVKPGDRHQFEALKDSVVFELYWVTLSADDIERFTQGGPVVAAVPSAKISKKRKRA